MLQGLATQYERVQSFCLSFDIHFEHIKLFLDLFMASSPDFQLGPYMQISQIYDDIWKNHQVFVDIAHGRSWQNFSKSEQEKLRGKLDSANSNFRLPPSNAFARVLLSVWIVIPSSSQHDADGQAPNGEQTALRDWDVTMKIRSRRRSGNWCSLSRCLAAF